MKKVQFLLIVLFTIIYVSLLSALFNKDLLSNITKSKVIEEIDISSMQENDNNPTAFVLDIPLKTFNNGNEFQVALNVNNKNAENSYIKLTIQDLSSEKSIYDKNYNIGKGKGLIVSNVHYDKKDAPYILKLETKEKDTIENVRVTLNGIISRKMNTLCYAFEAFVYSVIIFSIILFFYYFKDILFNFRNITDFLIVGIITFVVFGYIFNNFNFDLINVPVYLLGRDDVHYMSILKNAMDGNSYWLMKDLDAPFGATVYKFPLLITFYYFFGRLFGLFTDNVIFVNNIYYLCTFIFSSYAFFIIAKKFNINYFLAILGGLLFSFSQYHLLRHMHVAVASYFVVAIVFYFCIKIIKDEKFNQDNLEFNEKIKLYIGLILGGSLIASVEIYNIFFAYAFFFFSIIIVLFNKRYIACIRGIVLILLIFIILFNNLLPSIVYTFINSSAGSPLRSPHEAIYYGFMLVNLFVPYNQNGLPIFSHLRDSYDKLNLPYNEIEFNYLGVIGVIGFMILILFLLIAPLKNVVNKIEDKKSCGILSLIAACNFLALLIGMKGGLGAISAFLGFVRLRSYNRISIYILLFSIFTFIYLVDILFKRFFKNYKQVFFCFFSLCILCFHLKDTNLRSLTQDFNVNKEKIDSVKEYATNISNYYKKTANILNLPVLSFAENYIEEDFVNCNYQALPYLFSKNIKYSFGAFNNSKDFSWQKSLFDSSDVEEIVFNAKNQGFDGISVNTDIYNDNKIVTDLESILGSPVFVSSLKNIYFFDLNNYKNLNDIKLKDENLIEDDYYLSGGWSFLENSNNSPFRWGQKEEEGKDNSINSYINFISQGTKPYKFFLKVHSPIENNLKVYINDNLIGDFKVAIGDNNFETNTVYRGYDNKFSKIDILKLEHSSFFNPKDLDENSRDRRKLTVGYREISLQYNKD